jgi:beta-lactamase class A
MAELLVMLQNGKILGATTTDTLLAIMTRAVTGRARIPALLPPGTPVAHKTGTISSTTNDVGIITLPGGRGHLALVVFVKGSRVGVRAREQAIASAAALIYRHVMSLP